jgi:hypothetical protein
VGLDTLMAPVAGLIAFVVAALLTQASHPPRHRALLEIPSDEDLVRGAFD